jgi:transposase InsO family protein
MLTQHHMNAMLAEWSETILSYDFKVTHLPGANNVLADALSRAYPVFVWEERGANRNTPSAAKANGGTDSKVRAFTVAAAPPPEEKKQDAAAIKVTELIIRPKSSMAEWVKGRLNKRVPPVEERLQLMEQAHTKGHFGAEELYLQLWYDDTYWDNMKADCEELVAKCMQCLRYNVTKRGFHPQQSIQAVFAFDHVAIDNFKMETTSPRGFNFVLVMVDIATRFVLLAPLENERASTIARRLWEWCCTFGVPKVIQSDNGTGFVNKVVGKMLAMMGVDHRLIAAYNPRANGAAERHVKTAKDTLLKYCEGNVANFDLCLPAVQFAINTKMARLHKSTPFALMFARKANPLQDYREVDIKLLSEDELQARNQCMLDIVFPTIEQAVRKTLKKRDEAVDASRILLKEDMPVGAQVMIKDLLRTSKAEPRWVGPYWVLSKKGSSSYRLRDSSGEEFKKLVPVDQIKLVAATVDPASIEPTYVVDRLTDHRKNKSTGATEYLVKWKYGEKDTWEPVSSFEDNDLIRRYWAARDVPKKHRQNAAVGKRGQARERKAAKDVAALVPKDDEVSCDEEDRAGAMHDGDEKKAESSAPSRPAEAESSEPSRPAEVPATEAAVITGRFGRKRKHANPFRMAGAM